MVEITATMVKALRDATQQGMMECKKALTEASGDIEAAKDILRKKGLVTAEKKADRTTSEGLIGISATDTSIAMIEVQCETDFCSRNDLFRAMVQEVAEMAAAETDGKIEATEAITDKVQDAFAKIGENMSYARGTKITANLVSSYIHHNGKVGVIVGVDSDVDAGILSELCMHIAFTDPMGINPEDIPPELIEKEKKFSTEQAIESGKPAEIAEKMVAGKMKKYIAANALMEQPFIKDEKQSVKQILGGAKVTAFARFAVGSI